MCRNAMCEREACLDEAGVTGGRGARAHSSQPPAASKPPALHSLNPAPDPCVCFIKSIYSLEFSQRTGLGLGRRERGIWRGARDREDGPALPRVSLSAWAPGRPSRGATLCPLSSQGTRAPCERCGRARRRGDPGHCAAWKWTRQANRIAEEAEGVAELGLRPGAWSES